MIMKMVEDKGDTIDGINFEGTLSSTEFPSDSLEYQLERGISLLQERRAKNGDKYQEVYKQFGKVLLSLFPAGIHIEPNDIDKAIKLGVIVQKVTKLTRYCASLDEGGHLDSALDDMNYSAMLASVTKTVVNKRNKNKPKRGNYGF